MQIGRKADDILSAFLQPALGSPGLFSSSTQVEKRCCLSKLAEMPLRALKMWGIPQMPGKC